MTKATIGVIILMAVMQGCSSTSRESLSDVNPTRQYRAGVHDIFEAIRAFSLKDEFRLDRFGEEAGRIIGHKNAQSSSRQGREFSVATTAMMIVMNVKAKRLSDTETEIVVNFAFESGHGTVTREEEGMLLDCYSTFLNTLDGQFVQLGQSPG